MVTLENEPNSVLIIDQFEARKYNWETKTISTAVQVFVEDTLDNPLATDRIVDDIAPIVAAYSRGSQVTAYRIVQDHARVRGTADRDSLTLTVSRSEDDGETWCVVNTIALSDLFIDATEWDIFYELSVAVDERGRGVLLLGGLKLAEPDDVIRFLHFASIDGGLNWSYVGEYGTGSFEPISASVATDDEAFFIGWHGFSPAVTWCSKITTPFTDLDGVDHVQVSSGAFVYNPTRTVTICLADGRVVVASNADASLWVYESRDKGATWEAEEPVFAFGGGQPLVRLIGAEASSRIVWGVSANYYSVYGSTQAIDLDRIVLLTTGGWDGLPLPRVVGTLPPREQSYGADVAYLPFAVADGQGWATVGSPVSSISGTTTVTTVTGGSYKIGTSATYVSGSVVRFQATSTSTTGGQTGVKLRIGASPAVGVIQVHASITTTSWFLYDSSTATLLATGPLLGATHFCLAMSKTGAPTANAVFYTSSDGEEWVAVADVTPSLAAATIASEVEFGVYSGTAEFRISQLLTLPYSGSRSGTVAQPYDDLAFNPLQFAPWSHQGGWLPVTGTGVLETPSGLKLAGGGGWAQRGEVWDVTPISPYPPENLAVPSPRAYAALDVNSVEASYMLDFGIDTCPSPAIGLAVSGCFGLREIVLEGKAGSGSWRTLATIPLDFGLADLDLRSTGKSLTPVAPYTGTVSRFVARDELAGCVVWDSSDNFWEVESNSEGWFGGTSVQARILLKEGAVAPSATETYRIGVKEGACIAAQLDRLEPFKEVRIRVPVTPGPTGQKIGTAVWGPFQPLATKYSHGRVLETTPGVVSSATEAGYRHMERVAPSRRAVQVAWSEGFDSTPTMGDGGDFIALPVTSTFEVAARGNASIMNSILDACEDGTLPVAYLPKVLTAVEAWTYPDPEGDSVQIGFAGRELSIIGRIVGSHTREGVLGEEGTSEVVRISGVRLEEEV
jgi:hypothetical protein